MKQKLLPGLKVRETLLGKTAREVLFIKEQVKAQQVKLKRKKEDVIRLMGKEKRVCITVEDYEFFVKIHSNTLDLKKVHRKRRR